MVQAEIEMKKRLRYLSGFTFIEVLMAILILGTVLVPISGMFAFSLRSGVLNEQRLIVCNLLQRKLEEVKKIGRAHV